MKGLSILLSVSLFVLAAFLGHALRRAGALPAQISGSEKAVTGPSVPVSYIDYGANNPHHLN